MDDLISRQAAIDILDAYQVMLENGEENPYSWARFRMSELPAAQPEKCEECGNFNKARLLIPQPERTDCTECPEYDTERHYCPKYCDVIRRTLGEAKQERKTGHWINIRAGNIANCDQCGVTGRAWMNYCPVCGSDNREGES